MLLDGTVDERNRRHALEVIERNAQVQAELARLLARLDRTAQGGAVRLLPLALTGVLEEVAGVFDFQLVQHGRVFQDLQLGRIEVAVDHHLCSGTGNCSVS